MTEPAPLGDGADAANGALPNHFFDIREPDPPGGRGVHIALVSGIGLATVVAIVALMASMESFDPVTMAIACLIPLLVTFSIIGFFDHRNNIILDQKLRTGCSTVSYEYLHEILTPGWIQLGDRTKKIAQQLVRCEHQGFVVRVFKKNVTPFGHPLDNPFEPMPLDESSEAFIEAETLPLAVPASGSKLRRNIRFGGGWVMVILFGITTIFAALGSFRSGKISPQAIQFLLMMLVPILGIGGRGAWRTNRQWLLVPSGIVVRKAGMFKKKWFLHLFQRADSALFVRQNSKQIWSATVADGNSWATVQMTTRESFMLLRTWLSPLPTPPLEQLSDLT